MATKFIESILGYIDTRLQAGMAAKLNVIDTEKGDFVLDDIVNYYQAKKILISNFPSIEIYPVNSPGSDKHSNAVECNHTIAIRVSATGDDEETIAKKIYRYQRAITEVIKTDDDLGGNVDLCRFAGHEYEDWESMEGGAYLYRGIVLFEINCEETVQ